MSYKLDKLPYSYDSLEPYIDTKTMEIHHGKHHQAYITNLNNALDGIEELKNVKICELMTKIDNVPSDKKVAVINNGGGHFNHSMFWELLSSPNSGGGGEPKGKIADLINKSFGSFDAFKNEFKQAAITRFGSGWAWLCIDDQNDLKVCSTANQENPLMSGINNCDGKPIMGIDVWEHAYYLNYQNRRPDYIDAFWNVLNWSKVEEFMQHCSK